MRVKDPEHLIAKIIRKKILEPNRIIDKSNYLIEIQDLIGLKAIHLFKQRWLSIHNFIMKHYEVIGSPKGYYREGDPQEFITKLTNSGIEAELHNSGYRSIHYNIEIKPGRQKFIAEIQVRTIFEEGWSEIDHDLRYPYHTDNILINKSLQILNRLAGSSDELGDFINLLQVENSINEQNIHDRDIKIKEFQAIIENLKIEKNEKISINKKFADINEIPHILTSCQLGDSAYDQMLTKIARLNKE
ncbi:MAG: RelA/SpoT domain-containing protein [Saprospiraceae bacterium]|nr:RelA/SpoT domain-containing protein [Candidatus Defluviibacterium haderslevense]